MSAFEVKSTAEMSPLRKRRSGGGLDVISNVRPALEEIDLRNLWRTIWRWRALVASTVVIAIVAAIVTVNSLTPIYTASTQVAIGQRQDQVLNLPDILTNLKGDAETINTEIGVIRSRNLALKTVVKLGLDSNPEFNPEPGVLDRVKDWIADFLPPLPEWLAGPPSEPPAPEEEAHLVRVIDKFLDKLKVSSDGKSRIVTISFQSADPRLAAQVANTLADFYIVSQLDAKFEAARRANEWLSDRLTGLREETLAAEDAVEQFRREHGIVRGETSTIMTQEVSQVANDLVAARAARIEAQSRLSQVRSSTQGDNPDWNAVPEVLSNPLIQALRQQEADAVRRAGDLLEQYGEKHPRVINVRAEIREIRAKIQAEVGKIITGLRNELARQQAREASLQAMLDQLKGEASQSNIAQVQLRDLERTAEAARTLYENFLQRFKETQSQENFQQPDADIISRAVTPLEPTFPQKTVFVILSALAGILVGALLALIFENLDVGIRSTDQVRRLLKVEPIGLVPATKGSKGGAGPVTDILERPASAFAEAVRTVHTNLLLADVDNRARTVLVTSALPGEGKSTLAASLAQMAARYGRRVIVVDCDLRRPRLHRIWGVPQEPGVANWLLHEKELNEIYNDKHPSGAHIIPAGRLPSTPPNLLGSDRFSKMLHALRNHYDLVILDSAPVLAVADTRALAAFADKTLFVVHWAQTPRKVAAEALDCLHGAGADIAGAIIMRVDVKAHAKDGFSDSVLYAGKLKEYYR